MVDLADDERENVLMTRNTIRACIVLPFALVLGLMTAALVVTQTASPLPELETMEGFMWTHKPWESLP